jgi:hypothetical protein
MPKKKFCGKLPNKLIPLNCVDKKNHEVNSDKRNLANFIRPWRMVLCGGVSRGKSATLKNIILRQRPHFKKIVLLHTDVNSTEWDDLDLDEKLDDIPDLDYWELDGHTLLIIEDMDLNPKDVRLSQLMRYVSSHKSVSIACLFQQITAIPTVVRRNANIFVLFDPKPDLVNTRLIEARCGLGKGELTYLFKHVATNFHDSICLDLTNESRAPMRLNIFEPIRKVSKEELKNEK